jgi:hypothetical protein
MSQRYQFYIAGKISGLEPEEVKENFRQAENKLLAIGLHYASPYKPKEEAKKKTWQQYMREGVIMMMKCPGVFLLKNWRASRGANIERQLAMSLGIPVLYEELLDQGHYEGMGVPQLLNETGKSND